MQVKQLLKNEKITTFLYVLLITGIFGFLAHSYAFYNPSLANDGLQIDLLVDRNWQVSIGRFLQPLVRYFTLTSYNPFLSGFFWILFFSIGIYFICKTLQIKNLILIGVFSALIITNCAHLEAFDACENWNVIFSFNFMLAILSVYVFNRYKFGYIFSGLLIVVVFAIYPSFVCVAISLFVICTIKKLLNESFTTSIKYLLKSAGVVIVATICYFILFKLVLKASNITLKDDVYNSPSQVKFLGLKTYIILTIKSYLTFAKTLVLFNTNTIVLTHGGELVMLALLTIVAIISVMLFIRVAKDNHLDLKKIVTIVLLIVVLPICCCFFFIVTDGLTGHRLYYASFLIYVLPIILYEESVSLKSQEIRKDFEISKLAITILSGIILVFQLLCYIVIKRYFFGRIFMKFFYQTFLLYLIPLYMGILLNKNKKKGFLEVFAKAIVSILISVTLLNNIMFCNEKHFDNHLRYQATYNEMSNLLEIMEESEDFNEDNDIFIVGEFAAYPNNYELGVTYDGTIIYFFNFIFNRSYSYPIQKNVLLEELTSSEIDKINNMPCYPSQDCVKTVGDITIIKLSNVDI